MTIAEAQKQGENVLRRAGIESLRIDTSLLLEKVTGKPRAWLFAHLEEPLEDPAAHEFMTLINRRGERVPLVHLTNHREFYSLDLYINEHVLTPRIETETMVDYAIKYAPKGSRLIDVGTGSGALAIAIKKHRPDLEVWATDVSEQALDIARKNAEEHGTTINMLASDLLTRVRGRFATVVANLPYLRNDAELMPEVLREPSMALFGGDDGLDLYRRFLRQLSKHLEPSGYLFTECDPWQHGALTAAAAENGLRPVESKDYFVLGFQLNLVSLPARDYLRRH